MSYSANEIQTLAGKAARGAGFPPAQAEMFGQVAALHLAAGGAPEPLLDALTDSTDSPVLRLPLLMDDVLRACDTMGGEFSLSLQGNDGALAPSYLNTLPIKVEAATVVHSPDAPAKLCVVANPGTRAAIRMPARLTAPAEMVERLKSLAARTFVPATEASRLNGAGAGLTDND